MRPQDTNNQPPSATNPAASEPEAGSTIIGQAENEVNKRSQSDTEPVSSMRSVQEKISRYTEKPRAKKAAEDAAPPPKEEMKWGEASLGKEAQEAEKNKRKRADIRVIKKKADEETVKEIRESEPDLIKRADALFKVNCIPYTDKKKVGDATQVESTDGNRWDFFLAMFGDGEDRPHFDTFKGRVVDGSGRIIDDHYPVVELVRAMSKAHLKKQSAIEVRKALAEWAKGAEWNSLIKYVETKIPDWDGIERMTTKLIELFRCDDTELNRRFARYFWLSLYCRVMMPGGKCYAPIVMCLIGGQHSGKSNFSRLLCQTIMGDPDANPTQLNFGVPLISFLRSITGLSIIATIGEMTKFTSTDLNEVKEFIQRTTDPIDFKYEGHFVQPRQWIVILDGNKYEGLQRDATGNRRFYPVFAGQLPDDKDGKRQWDLGFRADFEKHLTENDIWQLLAEARAWLDANNGLTGYLTYVGEVSDEVQAFSEQETRNNSGTIADPELDLYFKDALLTAAKRTYQKRKTNKNSDDRKGVLIEEKAFIYAYKTVSGLRKTPIVGHVRTKMSAAGAEYGKYANNATGYFFPTYESAEAMNKALTFKMKSDDEEDGWEAGPLVEAM